MRACLKILAFVFAVQSLLAFAMPSSSQDVSGLMSSLKSKSIPVEDIAVRNHDVLLTLEYQTGLREAMDHLEFALLAIFKEAASEFPGSSSLQLEAFVEGEKACAFDIATKDALEGVRGGISDEELMSRLRGKPLLNIAERLGRPARASSAPSVSPGAPASAAPSSPAIPPSAAGPAPSPAPGAGYPVIDVGYRIPDGRTVLLGILIAGNLLLLAGIIVVRRRRAAGSRSGRTSAIRRS